jgi:hypothetical protein
MLLMNLSHPTVAMLSLGTVHELGTKYEIDNHNFVDPVFFSDNRESNGA